MNTTNTILLKGIGLIKRKLFSNIKSVSVRVLNLIITDDIRVAIGMCDLTIIINLIHLSVILYTLYF